VYVIIGIWAILDSSFYGKLNQYVPLKPLVLLLWLAIG
jgi:hypothetical protein